MTFGEPGVEIDFEEYLHELSKEADVPHLVGHVGSDGLFHLGRDGIVR